MQTITIEPPGPSPALIHFKNQDELYVAHAYVAERVVHCRTLPDHDGRAQWFTFNLDLIDSIVWDEDCNAVVPGR